MELELRLAVEVDWDALPQEEVLPRFLRALEAGGDGLEWECEVVDAATHFAWYARAVRPDRVHFISLEAEREGRPGERPWALTVESGPAPEGPPALRAGEWLLGAVVALAVLLLDGRIGLALVALLACGLIMPRLLRRRKYEPGEAPDDIDRALLDRIKNGAEQFASFKLVGEWREAV